MIKELKSIFIDAYKKWKNRPPKHKHEWSDSEWEYDMVKTGKYIDDKPIMERRRRLVQKCLTCGKVDAFEWKEEKWW